MTIRTDCGPASEARSPAEVEAALRWLATRKDGEPLRFLREAIEDPASESADVLRSLVEPTAPLSAEGTESRAFAIWGLLVDEIGSAGNDRRRATLMAAFRVPPAPSGTAWKAKLGDRFRQLMVLPRVFGDPPPTTTTPMNQAWRWALQALAASLTGKLGSLEGLDWQPYVDIGRGAVEATNAGCVSWRARAASKGAQPVFVERMLVRAVMHRRTVQRRITERAIVACEVGVDGYNVHARIGWKHDPGDLPVKALWACRVAASPRDPAVVWLRFRRTLRKGERYEFVSEALDGHLEEERRWLDVAVDHHGIAPGGLTIQLNFDAKQLPEACWWYAEQLEFERTCQPPQGDPHLLPVGDGFVQHTFLEGCHPRESYGVAFRWKSS